MTEIRKKDQTLMMDSDEVSIVEHSGEDGVELEQSGAAMKARSSERRTLPRMTKYEKAHVLGVRASQLSSGASPFIDIGNESNPLAIASIELNEKKIPFIVRRKFPDGSYEDWAIDELMVPGVDFQ